MKLALITLAVALLSSAAALRVAGRHHEDGEEGGEHMDGDGYDHSHGNSSMTASSSAGPSASSPIAAAGTSPSGSAAFETVVYPGALTGILAAVAALTL